MTTQAALDEDLARAIDVLLTALSTTSHERVRDARELVMSSGAPHHDKAIFGAAMAASLIWFSREFHDRHDPDWCRALDAIETVLRRAAAALRVPSGGSPIAGRA